MCRREFSGDPHGEVVAMAIESSVNAAAGNQSNDGPGFFCADFWDLDL